MEPLSKNQMKKLKRKEEWEKKKQEKKNDKKNKKRSKKAKCLYTLDRAKWESQKSQGLKVVIDCEFESLLTEKEKTSLRQQIMYCYALNKRSDTPLNMTVTGLSQSFESEIQKMSLHPSIIELTQNTYLSLFSKENLVYLTADSNTELLSFDNDTTYIVGGLVDHNRLKNITFAKAQEQNIRTAKFPLSKYVQLDSSSVLTVNHVVSLILSFAESGSWQSSIINSIPARKIIKLLE